MKSIMIEKRRGEKECANRIADFFGLGLDLKIGEDGNHDARKNGMTQIQLDAYDAYDAS